MLSIADFGGFTGLAKLITEVKSTRSKLDKLTEKTGITEIQELKIKYVEALDKFRPNNTDEVAAVATSFNSDADRVQNAIKTKISDQEKQQQAEQEFVECRETTDRLLGICVNALKNAGVEVK